ncbi:hypothetical protein [Bradyrhizobium sp. NAS96.2]|nr:hypothetical protein [Bradyrhizobium sp. NAS96.2]
MAEFIINVIVDVVTDIWTLQCLARWRRKKQAAEVAAFDQRSN